ncbi:voltage-dependent chloride channel 1, chloroplastic [Beta vulgaris subsp. vulgaris]|uniref:voltage-dependent chloride channel 1, chloroplastic n=1 Tax=Beta vulgaris subsp. vulgaris TaxID=3555 RepID=UPI002036DB75|nr:voltage-dependent chloride channel 1, chloroplastic [Beta vulgaris subsp. vulgaris]
MSNSSSPTINPPSKPPLSSKFTPKITHKLFPSSIPSKPTKKLPLKIQSLHHPDPQNPRKTLNLISILKSLPDWADEVQEKGMRKKRLLYNQKNWAEHRSSLRHVRHLLSSLSSRVIVSLLPPVVFFTSVAVFISVYNTAVTMNLLPGFFPVLRASSLPYQLTAPALALLLVFRTEASYSRYEEGRKAWTKVIARTSDIAREVIACVDDFNDEVIKRSLLQYIMSFPIALKCHLLYDSDIRRDLQSLLDADDLAVVLSSKHRPQCIIQFISESLQLLNVEEQKRNILDSKLSCFHEGIGICEQIVGTPIPLSYTRLTSRFLVLWHLTLPVILWDDCHWIVVPATFISAASLFCIEEVGVLIEEPFPMLALDELCKVVCNDIQDNIAIQKTIQMHITAKRKTHHREHTPNGWPASSGDKTW